MWKKVNQYVESHHMISDDDRILLGLSGGPDSVLLARYLIHLRDQTGIVIHAIHVNHLIRSEEADRDQTFVMDFCRKWGIPFRVYEENVTEYAENRKLSLEEAGREVRSLRMKEYALEHGCNKIALAHHKDDQAETMIFRMVRGTGPDGLPGILPVYDNKIRPLLCLEKKDILEMLSAMGQNYVTDSTNKETDYTRNYIRHQIIPALCQVNSQAVEHISRLSDQLQAQNEFVKAQVDRIYDQEVEGSERGLSISLEYLRKCRQFLSHEIIRRMIFETGGRRRDIGSVHIEMVERLIDKGSGKQNNLPYGLLAFCDAGRLYIGKTGIKEKKETVSLWIPKKVFENQKYRAEAGEKHFLFEIISHKDLVNMKRDCVKYFDYDRIKNGVSIRTRRQGDYFVLDSSGKRKTIRRYFIDEKIPACQRDEIYMLVEDSHVLWVTTGRISEAYKVTEDTRRILKVEYNGG